MPAKKYELRISVYSSLNKVAVWRVAKNGSNDRTKLAEFSITEAAEMLLKAKAQ